MIKLTPELEAIGQAAINRAREDGCASLYVLGAVYFKAIVEYVSNQKDVDQEEAALLTNPELRAVGKVLTETEMSIGYDRRNGNILWYGQKLKPGSLIFN